MKEGRLSLQWQENKRLDVIISKFIGTLQCLAYRKLCQEPNTLNEIFVLHFMIAHTLIQAPLP